MLGEKSEIQNRIYKMVSLFLIKMHVGKRQRKPALGGGPRVVICCSLSAV